MPKRKPKLTSARHYTLGELAKEWHVSRDTVAGWFRDEPDIIRWETRKRIKGRERTCIFIRIPPRVAARVKAAHTPL